MFQSFLNVSFAVWNIFIHQCHILVWVNRTLGYPGCQKAGPEGQARRFSLYFSYSEAAIVSGEAAQDLERGFAAHNCSFATEKKIQYPPLAPMVTVDYYI